MALTVLYVPYSLDSGPPNPLGGCAVPHARLTLHQALMIRVDRGTSIIKKKN